MVLVIRPGLEPNTAALGSGSIVSPRHVLTVSFPYFALLLNKGDRNSKNS